MVQLFFCFIITVTNCLGVLLFQCCPIEVEKEEEFLEGPLMNPLVCGCCHGNGNGHGKVMVMDCEVVGCVV